MPGKRKTSTQRDSAKAPKKSRGAATTDADKRDIVAQVVNELQPFIEDTIKSSLANIGSNQTKNNCTPANEDDDLEVIFNTENRKIVHKTDNILDIIGRNQIRLISSNTLKSAFLSSKMSCR